MMNHDSASKLDNIIAIIAHPRAKSYNNTSWLVPRNDLWAFRSRLSIVVQVAATHSRSLNFDDYFSCAGRRIWKSSKGYFSISHEHDSTHLGCSSPDPCCSSQTALDINIMLLGCQGDH
jgi:hypothetical protein